MANSAIRVSGLRTTGGANQILLSWDNPVDPNRGGLPYLQLRAIEVWASTTPDHNDAVLLGESVSIAYVHSNVPRGATYYYWIRPRDVSGLYGDWYPSASSAGVVGHETNVNALLQPNGYFHYADGRVEEWGQTHSTSYDLGGGAGPTDGVVQKTFQSDFVQIFGLTAMGMLLESGRSEPASYAEQFVNLTLYKLTTHNFIMRASIIDQFEVTATNDALIYWRAFGI